MLRKVDHALRLRAAEHVLAETQQQRQALLAAQAAVEQELAKAKEELQVSVQG